MTAQNGLTKRRCDDGKSWINTSGPISLIRCALLESLCMRRNEHGDYVVHILIDVGVEDTRDTL